MESTDTVKEDLESRFSMRFWSDLVDLSHSFAKRKLPGTFRRIEICRSSLILKHFNAEELIGLRELMLSADTKRLDEYKRIWRRNHNVPDGAPSTLYKIIPKSSLKEAS